MVQQYQKRLKVLERKIYDLEMLVSNCYFWPSLTYYISGK
jgi:hypothetical protein